MGTVHVRELYLRYSARVYCRYPSTLGAGNVVVLYSSPVSSIDWSAVASSYFPRCSSPPACRHHPAHPPTHPPGNGQLYRSLFLHQARNKYLLKSIFRSIPINLTPHASRYCVVRYLSWSGILQASSAWSPSELPSRTHDLPTSPDSSAALRAHENICDLSSTIYSNLVAHITYSALWYCLRKATPCMPPISELLLNVHHCFRALREPEPPLLTVTSL